jgi:hypothetical protein
VSISPEEEFGTIGAARSDHSWEDVSNPASEARKILRTLAEVELPTSRRGFADAHHCPSTTVHPQEERMPRLVLSLLLAFATTATPRPVPAQQPVPVRALCFPADQVRADIESGRAILRDLQFTDGEGDVWVELRLGADGPAFIGWLSAAQGLFCAVGIRPPRPAEGAPEHRT